MNSSLQNLSKFQSSINRGRSFWVEVLWRVVMAGVFQNPFCPFYAPKRGLLRLFGAKVGKGVLIKPRVTITFPWRLTLGDHVWIGEGVWLDNLANVEIEDHVCISQGAYLCTGNHDFRVEGFDLRVEPIILKKSAWVGAQAVVGPGVTVEEGAVLSLGSVATQTLETRGIYQGNPARKVGQR